MTACTAVDLVQTCLYLKTGTTIAVSCLVAVCCLRADSLYWKVGDRCVRRVPWAERLWWWWALLWPHGVSITLCQVRGQRVGYTVVIQPSYRTIMRCIHAIHGMLRVVTAGRANKRSSPSTGILLLVRILEYIFVTGDTSGSAQSIYGKTENDH